MTQQPPCSCSLFPSPPARPPACLQSPDEALLIELLRRDPGFADRVAMLAISLMPPSAIGGELQAARERTERAQLARARELLKRCAHERRQQQQQQTQQEAASQQQQQQQAQQETASQQQQEQVQVQRSLRVALQQAQRLEALLAQACR